MAAPSEKEMLYVGNAYTENNDGRVCFDLPKGLIDWNEYAQLSLGETALRNPDPNVLRKNFFEVGRVSVLKFEAIVPSSISRTNWLLLHENGCDQVRPTLLRGEVMYDVDRNFRIIGRRPASSKACIGGSDKNVRAAFVLRGTTAGAWSSHRAALETDRPGHFLLSLLGQHFAFTNPDATVPRVKDVLLFKVAEQKSVILVVWESDRKCEKGCCEFAYSLYEMGSEGLLQPLGENLYGCDV
jgi:hypothetical protein